MMRLRIAALLLLVAVGVSLNGCASDELQGTRFDNEAPRVWLSAAPPEGTVSDYTLQLFWGGWDPDGEIAFYEYIITNNEGGVFDPADTTSTLDNYRWRRVFANDSTFRFTADLVADSTQLDERHRPEEFRRSHTFFIRAVDDRGRRSDKPAYRSFTSRTLSPTVNIIVPARGASALNPAQVPPIATYQWTATDFVSNQLEVQDPDSVRFIMVPISEERFAGSWELAQTYVQQNPDAPEWSEWLYYLAPGDSGQKWTSPPLDFGGYVFAVQAKDEAGAVSPVFDLDSNMRRVLVSTRSTGPVFTVRNQFIGTIVTSNPNTTPTILDLPAGVELQFEFEADASSYGGLVSGYRYGWDIFDLNDPEQWEIYFTPFIGSTARSPRRKFFFGSHTWHCEVVDNSGFKSRVSVTVNVIPFTMTRGLLFIDDWQEGALTSFRNSKGAIPSDQEHDAFWLEMLRDVEGFIPQVDVFSLGPGVPTVPITVVADYQNIVWSATSTPAISSNSAIVEMVRFKDPNVPQTGGKTPPNIPGLFMAAGGHLLLAGENIMTMVINKTSFQGSALVYPIIFRYELSGDQDGVYTGDGNDVGRQGVGETSFAYNECCLNVLDISYLQNLNAIRRPPFQEEPPGTGCPVNLIRQHSAFATGMRAAEPADLTTGGGFPRLDLRPEVSDPGRRYATVGMVVDLYNPEYFVEETSCAGVAEITPVRSCFQPIYSHVCNDENALVYGATVAFWTSRFAGRVPDVGGVGARSAIFGFHPVFFNPDQFKPAMDIILFDEWQLPRKQDG